jgi:hypothetical protein
MKFGYLQNGLSNFPANKNRMPRVEQNLFLFG